LNEDYLQYIWKKKRLPLYNITTTSGEKIEFIHVGNHNENESGPDFTCAKIRIGNILWAGSIEIHVKSSDWYRHKHHLDRAYNNVILHVVYFHDTQVEIQGNTIPVIELKHYIDHSHFVKYNKIIPNKKNIIPCSSLFNDDFLDDLEAMKTHALHKRLLRKSKDISFLNYQTETHLLLILSARAFGASVNSQIFEQVMSAFSLLELKSFDEQMESYVMKVFLWKKKGLKANTSPLHRFKQFLNFIRTCNLDFPFWELPPSLIKIHFENEFKKANINSSFLLNNFLINSVARFIFWKSNSQDDQILMKKAFGLLLLISKEDNHIIRKWNTLNVYSKNAFDSQALLEIYEQLCMKRACLNCSIGKKILVA
jgi:hypothetical protein